MLMVMCDHAVIWKTGSVDDFEALSEILPKALSLSVRAERYVGVLLPLLNFLLLYCRGRFTCLV